MPPLGELAVYLDGRASESARQGVDRHLAVCAPCARIVTDARAFFGEAFSKSTRIVFLSDTHLWQSDEREEPTRQYSARMAAAYNQTQHFQTGQPTNPVQAFEETLSHAVEQRA